MPQNIAFHFIWIIVALPIISKAQNKIVYSAFIGNGPERYGYNRMGDHYKYFSPLHRIKKKPLQLYYLVFA
ncbi:hypothetical protein, partial [Saccharicrinis fermentans]|uniref:hypothetical protein n=1 Tax=Saccharicrinis fermentans TaxID=982 RepID=UPI0005C6BBAA